MAKIKLTKRFIDDLPFENTTKIYQDSLVNGFAVRVNKTTKTYMINKRINGDLKRLAISDCTLMTLQDARDRAVSLIADLVNGINPRAEVVKIPTLKEAYEHYLSEKTNLKPLTVTTYNRQILGKLKDWLDIPLNDITQSDVTKKHLEMSKDSPAQSNATMRAFAAVWNYARLSFTDSKENQVIKTCPTEILTAKKLWNTVKPRTRHLNEDTLGSYIKTVVDFRSEDFHSMQPHSNNARDVMLLFACTGLRANEGYQLKWSNVNLQHGTITLDNTKNSDEHSLPLGDVMVAMLKHRHQYSEGSKWVFPSRLKASSGNLTNAYKQYINIGELAGVHITPHDLRRTFSTVANILGLNISMIKRLMNHRQSKISDDVTLQYIQISQKQVRKSMNDIEKFIFGEAGMKQAEVIEQLYK